MAAISLCSFSRDVVTSLHNLLPRPGTAHGRLAWHHFFPEWLATLRFISGKKDPTLPALRPSLQGHGIGVRARASCAAPRRRTPKQAELDLSEAGMPSEVKRERVPGNVPV